MWQGQQRVAILLLNEQILAMRLDDAQLLLQRLQGMAMQGDYGVFVALNDASLDEVRGRYARGTRS